MERIEDLIGLGVDLLGELRDLNAPLILQLLTVLKLHLILQIVMLLMIFLVLELLE